jgi:2-polyprenyl-6-methoxyphenol hydroxylase-like FAD-dependent oxidoreductase
MSIKTAIVIGGGIAGPVAATALRKAGIEADVYESWPAQSEGIGGSLAIAPNGMAALDVVGAGDAVRASALPITGTRMAIRDHKPLSLPALDGVEPMQMVGRGNLHRALHDRAVAEGVGFHWGNRLVGADEDRTGITARFEDGSTARADVLVGADGVRSTVRTLIDPQAPSANYTGLLGFQGWVPAAPGSPLDPPPGLMTFAFGSRAYYLFWREADGRVTWGANLPSTKYLSLSDARKVPSAQWLATLRETYQDDVPGQLLADGTTADTLDVTGAIHIMPSVPHWHRGRMVLVGDAVHAPSNSTGQGASLAIESAVQLARCLRDRPDPASAFTAYEGLRRTRVEAITRRGARVNSTKTPGRVGGTMMRMAMPLMLRVMSPEKMFGSEQRYTIDWSARIS